MIFEKFFIRCYLLLKYYFAAAPFSLKSFNLIYN